GHQDSTGVIASGFAHESTTPPSLESCSKNKLARTGGPDHLRGSRGHRMRIQGDRPESWSVVCRSEGETPRTALYLCRWNSVADAIRGLRPGLQQAPQIQDRAVLSAGRAPPIGAARLEPALSGELEEQRRDPALRAQLVRDF